MELVDQSPRGSRCFRAMEIDRSARSGRPPPPLRPFPGRRPSPQPPHSSAPSRYLSGRYPHRHPAWPPSLAATEHANDVLLHGRCSLGLGGLLGDGLALYWLGLGGGIYLQYELVQLSKQNRPLIPWLPFVHHGVHDRLRC